MSRSAGPTPGDLAAHDHADSAWNRAAALTTAGDPFCLRTEWQFSFHETFLPRRPVHLREGRQSLVAFAERRGTGLGCLLEPLEASWSYGCPLLGPEALELLVRLLLEPRWASAPPHLLISGLEPDAAATDRLLATLRRRFRPHLLEGTVLVSASLDGGIDGFLSRRSARLRRNLRTAARRATTDGIRFERSTPRDRATAAAVYARMLAVEGRSWKGIGRCGMAEPPAREFYGRMLARLADAGNGRVVFARRDDDDIGFVFGGVASGTYRGQQFSFAEDWRAASLGNLLQLEQLRWLGEEGVERYDMGPLMPYKHHWTERTRRIETLLLQPRD